MEPMFDGVTIVASRDHERLTAQLEKVRTLMATKEWYTLDWLSYETGAPQASVSARIRDLRKPKFGGHRVERRYLAKGLWEYRCPEGY